MNTALPDATDVISTAVATKDDTTANKKSDSVEEDVKIRMSSQRICRYKKYEVSLLVKKCWRLSHKIDELQVLKALLTAKCCCLNTLSVVSCSRCGASSVVSLGATNGLKDISTTDGEYEVYSCVLTSNCSSSR